MNSDPSVGAVLIALITAAQTVILAWLGVNARRTRKAAEGIREEQPQRD